MRSITDFNCENLDFSPQPAKLQSLGSILLSAASLQNMIASGEVKTQGDPRKLGELIALLDEFEFWFNIVTP